MVKKPATNTVTQTTLDISQKAMLVSLKVSRWTASKHDKAISAEVANTHQSDVNMGRFSKRLVRKDGLEKINRIASAARAEHYKRTLPWNDDGMRILSATGYMAYAEAMRAFEKEFDVAVGDFVVGYPALVEDARNALGDLFDAKDYPEPRYIADRFSVGINTVPMPTSNDFRVSMSDAETKRIKHSIEQSVKDALDEAQRDVWRRMADVVQHMSDRLKSYVVTEDKKENPFRDTLVTNIRDLIALLPSLNVTESPAITAMADDMRTKLAAYAPDTLRASQFAREEAIGAADEILSRMQEYI